MRHFFAFLLALFFAGAAHAQTQVQFGLQTGSNPRALGVYDQMHTLVPFASLDSTGHTLTFTGPATLSSLTIAGYLAATTSGTLTNGHCVSINAVGNLVDAGAACTTGGGGGTVSSGAAGQLSYYVSTGTTVSGATTGTGVLTALGNTAGAAGGFALYSALGSGAFTAAYSLPAATSSALGGVKPDGTTLTNTSGAISVTYGTAASTSAQGNDSRITGALQTASLGSGVAAALGNTANANGGAVTLNGFPTVGDCLKWSSTGVQDAGGACATGATLSAAMDQALGSTPGFVAIRGATAWTSVQGAQAEDVNASQFANSSSLAAYINALPPNSEVSLLRGTYNVNADMVISAPNITIKCSRGAVFNKTAGANMMWLTGASQTIEGCTFVGNGYTGTGLIVSLTATDTVVRDVTVTGQGCHGINNQGARTHTYNTVTNNNGCVGFGSDRAVDGVFINPVSMNNNNEGFTIDNPGGARNKVIGGYLYNNCLSGGVGNLGTDAQNGVEIIGLTAMSPSPNCPYNIGVQNNVGNTVGLRIIGGHFGGISTAGGSDIRLNTQPTYSISGTPSTSSGGSGYAVNDTIYLPAGSTIQSNFASAYKVTSVGGGGAVTGISLVSASIPYGSSILPGNPAPSSTTGSGSGATFNISWAATGSYYGNYSSSISNAASYSSVGAVSIVSGINNGNNSIDMVAFAGPLSLNDTSTRFLAGGGGYFSGTVSFGPVPIFNGCYGPMVGNGGSAATCGTNTVIGASANYTLTGNQCGKFVELFGSSSITLTLPSATLSGCMFIVDNNASVSNTVATVSSQLIAGPLGSGATTKSMVANSALTLISDGTSWFAKQ